MRAYEVMVILEPSLDERTVAPTLDKFLKVVTTDGGTVENVDVWGRRRLAYEVNKNAEGIYAVVNLTAEPKTVLELDRSSDEIGRERHHRSGELQLRFERDVLSSLPAHRKIRGDPGGHVVLLRLRRRGWQVADVARSGEHPGRLQGDAGVNVALGEVAGRQEGAGAHHRHHAARAQERRQPPCHPASPGKASRSPSNMNCTARAPMISPITRFITLRPVTPSNWRMRSAATSIR